MDVWERGLWNKKMKTKKTIRKFINTKTSQSSAFVILITKGLRFFSENLQIDIKISIMRENCWICVTAFFNSSTVSELLENVLKNDLIKNILDLHYRLVLGKFWLVANPSTKPFPQNATATIFRLTFSPAVPLMWLQSAIHTSPVSIVQCTAFTTESKYSSCRKNTRSTNLEWEKLNTHKCINTNILLLVNNHPNSA